MWQPNSYTKPIFEACGHRDKNACYTLDEMHAVLETYVQTRLNLAEMGVGGRGGAPPSAPGGAGDESGACGGGSAAEVVGVLRRIGMASIAANRAAAAFAADGFDSLPALRAGALDTSELAAYGMCEGGAEALRALLAQGGAADAVRAWLVNRMGADGASAAACATALVADGYDSLDALAAGKVLACTRDLGLSARRSVEGMLAARPQIETRVSIRT